MNEKCAMGVFVWNELMTTDVEAARGFYTRLFGWRFKSERVGEMDYHMAFLGEKAIAGLMHSPPGQSIPSHWLSYVSVDDVDRRTDKAVRLGAMQIVAPTDIPKIGRFSVIRDPQGAFIAPFKGMQDAMPPADRPGHGDFVWHELMTPDPEKSKTFYRDIFEWGLSSHQMPDMTYWMFQVADKTVAGVWQMPAAADHAPHWLAYIGANDVDAVARNAVAAGGRILKAPDDIPEVGRFAVLSDTTGGAFAIFKSSSKS